MSDLNGNPIRKPCAPLKFQRPTSPHRVFATWNIHYGCNYRCTYCHAPKPGRPGVRGDTFISPERWLSIWQDLYDRYGTWEMLISGGEPFDYPGFQQLLTDLSRIHFVGVCTNLSWDVESVINDLDPERIRIETSLHPEFADMDVFVRRIQALRTRGFTPVVNIVPWPPVLARIAQIKARIESAGCRLTLQPFNGIYDGRSYPQGYTPEERRILGIFSDTWNEKNLSFQITGEAATRRGKPCRMGQNYVFIHPDGDTSRCCKDHSFSLGNLITGTFALLDEARPCASDHCNCRKCMLVERTDDWLREWTRTDITELAMKEWHAHDHAQ